MIWFLYEKHSLSLAEAVSPDIGPVIHKWRRKDGDEIPCSRSTS
jgi:hypothetical protein